VGKKAELHNLPLMLFDAPALPEYRVAIRVSKNQKEAAPTLSSVRLFLLNAISCPHYSRTPRTTVARLSAVPMLLTRVPLLSLTRVLLLTL
jgi:hypothetical protein